MKEIPEWLLTEETYVLQSDKNTFIDKSIQSILKVISRIKEQTSSRALKYPVSATLKVFSTLLLVVLLSVSRSPLFVMAVIVCLLVILSLMEVRMIVGILKVSCAAILFSAFVLLPAAIWGDFFNSLLLVSKVFANILAVNILSHSTNWNAIVSVLKSFFVPDMFIFVLDITLKYLVLSGDFALNMLQALNLRSVGRDNSKYTSLSGIVGTTFIKSKEMAEEMQSAMECRGFTGEYYGGHKLKMGIGDLLGTMLDAGIIFLFFVI